MTSRARSYGLMLAGGLVGGGLGALFDQVTVSISPEYFVLGKGLSGVDNGLRTEVAWLGFRGGLPLGVLVVGTGLWARTRWGGPRWSRLVAATAAVVGALMWLLDPTGVRLTSAGALDEHEAGRYLATWGAHIGAYLGAIAAVGVLVAGARSRAVASTSAAPYPSESRSRS
jgi:hypothetical protein